MRDPDRDVTSKELVCGFQRWAVAFSRGEKVTRSTPLRPIFLDKFRINFLINLFQGPGRVPGMAWRIKKPPRIRGLHVHAAESGALLHERELFRQARQVHLRGAGPGQPQLHRRG